MSTDTERGWWSYSPDEQKQIIVDEVDWRLTQEDDLSDRHKLLLRNAIGHASRGLFGLAWQDLYFLSLPESDWAPTAHVKPHMVEGVTRQTLRRWLEMLRWSPTQTQAIFC